MRKVNLTMQEQTKYEIIKSFVDNNLKNYKHLATKLNCCLKTAYNLVEKYHTKGKEGFSHGNHYHKPAIAKADSLKDEIIAIYNDKMQRADVNFSHFRDLLKRDHHINVSYNFIYNLLSSHSFYSPICQRKTIRKRNKLIKEKLIKKEKLTKFEQAIVADHLLDSSIAHPRKERSKYFGELLQMDASQHKWFGNYKTQLHIAIDDSTGRIVGAYFDRQETLFAYYMISRQFFLKYGIPASILTDNRTVFNYIKNGKGSEERDTFTQYGFMCHRLGIALQTSSTPQVKGRVERCFRTLQGRLAAELKLKKIETIEEANKFLEHYITEFNHQFSLPYNDTINAFEPLGNSYDLNEFLAICSHRKVDNGGVIKYMNNYYKFYNDNGIQVVPSAKQDCLVVKKFNGELIGMLNENSYHLEKFNLRKKTSIFDVPKGAKHRGHKPAWNHPWKKGIYDSYIKFYRNKQQNNYTYN